MAYRSRWGTWGLCVALAAGCSSGTPATPQLDSSPHRDRGAAPPADEGAPPTFDRGTAYPPDEGAEPQRDLGVLTKPDLGLDRSVTRLDLSTPPDLATPDAPPPDLPPPDLPPPDLPPPDLPEPDAPPPPTVTPFSGVEAAACQDGWLATGKSFSGEQCTAHLESAVFGVGSGAEPDRYGCRIAAAGGPVEAYLHELDCDDAGVISGACSGVCGDQVAFETGSIAVPGTTVCANAWQPTGAMIGAGKTCAAFVGNLRVGVGSGPEPSVYGCRYNAVSGAIEAYLYELGCDDKAGISLRCDWICAPAASAGQAAAATHTTTTCQASWQPLALNVGQGKTCVAGISFMRLGVGSGPEPHRYSCRYDDAADKLEGYLYELGCDDAAIELRCATFCFP